MKSTALRLTAAAALAACLSPAALAAQPAADHPAVLRAVAHLSAQAGLAAADDSYIARDLVQDTDGTEHVRLDRRFRGLRVVGGDVVVHSRGDGQLRGMTRTYGGALSLSTEPTLAADAAAGYAKGRFAHSQAKVESRELIVFARGVKPALAWDVVVSGVRADGTPSRTHLIVSAATKKVLEQWDDVHTADANVTGKTLFSGDQALHADKSARVYTLVDATRGGHKVVTMSNTTRRETAVKSSTATFGDGTLTSAATVAADAAYGQNVTWDYFLKEHGRSGIANDGAGAYSRVHYGRNYVNAFWSDDCFCMTYGDGDNGKNYYPLVALDVAGHEMTHGVTSRTAGLVYSGESGGLNEATSDIFGTMVEFYANNAKDTPDYLIGEAIFVKSGQYIRNMVQPSADGSSADCWYSTLGNLDVHYSSGPANHFYYLLAEGTTAGVPSKTCVSGNTKTATGTGTLTGLGRTKASKIWYRALTVYMTSSTNYAAARTATINAATDLYGATSAEVAAVKAAWTAINVN